MSVRDCERGVTSMRVLAELGMAHGLTMRACLAGTGVRERDLEDPAALVAPEQELMLIRNLVGHLKAVPALGVEAGLRYHFTAFGMLGLAMAASADAGSALEIALRYFNLTFAFTDFLATRTRDETLVTVDDTAVPPDLRRFVVERDIATVVRVQRDLCPHLPVLRGIAFSFPPPADEERHAALLGLRPQFGAARSLIRLDNAGLRQPLPQANAIARRAAEDQCRQLLERRRTRSGLALRIRERLLRETAAMPDMPAVAAELCMTPRTLRRRLAGEGTTFSAIRDEVRRALAEELLSMTDLSIAEIAGRLGYADPTCFTNAFKGWKNGMTPLAWRRWVEAAPSMAAT
ncbi:MAG: AraC family transcriptional regulator [Hyphomicrobiales bacterium]|nr:MAG: AraC family transcriptional regulator [Hyphomicrobiales bacterium]